MAKNINHLQHVKSSVVENGMPKLPAPSVLVEGELAVNYAADKETISLKNSSGDVVTFSSDNYYSEKKLGSWFIGENSGKTVTDVMRDDERIIAAALNDLKENKLDASAYTETDLSDYATKEWVGDRLGSGFTGENSGVTVTKVIEDDERAIAAALTDLDDRKLDASAFTESVGDFYTKEEVDEKLGADFSGTSYEQSVTEVISEIETVTAAALNDLNDRKLDMSAYTPTDLSNYYDKDDINGFLDEIDDALSGKVSSITINNSTKAPSNGNVNLGTVVSSMTVNGSAVTVTNGAAALTGLATASELLKYADNATYNSNDKKIYFKNGNTTLTSMTIDATAFIKDGMVNEVKIDEPTSGSNSGVTCLIVTFNTDAGKEDIEIPLSKIFDSNLYYTKTEIDNVLGSGFTVSSVTSSVTDVIRENEIIIASALNDLESKKLDASAYTPTDLSDYATEEWVNDRLGSGFTDSSVTEVFNETEEVIAEALADLDNRISGNTTYITQVNAKADTIARSLSGYTPSGYSYSKGEVDVKLADKLDASAYTPTDLSGYYTKQEIDEDKLGSGFTGANSGTTVTDAFNVVERVVAAALTDLNDRKLDASAYTETDLSDYYNKQAIDNKLGEWFSGSSSVTQVLREDELAISSALNDLEERKLDASAFTESVGDFYTKQEIDDFLGDWFTSSSAVSSVTEVIEENELIISQALNDLDERILEISGSSGGGGSSVMLPVTGSFNYLAPFLSTLGFSAYTYSDIIGMLQNYQDVTFIDENGQVYRSANSDEDCFEFVGQNAFYDSEMGLRFPVVSFCNDSIYFNLVTIPSSGGGSADALTGVSVNGTAASVSNKVANITSVPASIVATSSTRTFVSSDEKTTWNEKQDALSCGELKGTMNRSDVSGSGNISIKNTSGEFPTVVTAGTYKVVTYMSSTTQSYGLNVTFGGNAYSLTTSNGVIEDEREITITSNKTWSASVSGTVAANTVLIVKLYLISSNVSVLGLVAVSNDYDDLYNKPTIPTSLSDINSAHTHSEYALNTAFTAHTASTTAHVTSTEKSTWNGKQDALSNASVLSGITSAKVTQWDNAISGVSLNGTAASVTNHVAALTGVATTTDLNTHTANTTVHVTAANKTQWNNAISGVSFNGTTATVNNHVAAITATIPAAPGTLTTTATTAQATATNEALSGNIALHKVSKTGSYNDLLNKPTIPTVSNSTVTLTFNGATVGSFTLNGTGGTIDIGTVIGLPSFSASNNGQILGVVNGALAWVTPTTIYTGTNTPSSSQGNDGDIYLQTS